MSSSININMPKRKVVFKGKNIYYNNIIELTKKIYGKRYSKGTRQQKANYKTQAKEFLEDIRNGNVERYILNDDNEIIKYNIQEKPPLLLRNFGVSRFDNVKYLQRNTRIKNMRVINDLRNQTIAGKVFVVFNLFYDGTFHGTRQLHIFLSDMRTDTPYIDFELEALILTDPLWRFLRNSQFTIQIVSKEYSTILNQNLTWNDYGLENEVLNIENLFNETIPNNNGHCIIDYFKKIYKKISKKAIEKVKTIGDIYNFCVKYKIKMVCYDINGNTIKKNIENTTDTYKSLCFIAYNSHLYPLENKYLKKIEKPLKYDLNLVTDCNKEFINLLNIGKIGTYPNIYNDRITSFFYNKTLYFENKDFEKCKEILTKLNLEDKITPYITLKNISSIIEPLFIKSPINSFLPNCNELLKSPLLYTNHKLKDKKNIIQIDKNKCYSSLLKNLKYLLTTDIKTCIHKKVKKGEKVEIIESNLYIVKPKQFSTLLNNFQICSGRKLLICDMDKIEYQIMEYIECKKVENYYTEMILKLYNICDNDSFKDIINIMIGKFSQEKTIKQKQKFIKVCNEDEKNRIIGNIDEEDNETNIFNTKLDDDNYLLYTYTEKLGDIYNRHPINIQIKDECDILLYNKMKELNLKDEDIVKINTDSITFINKDDKYKQSIGNGLDDWKIETFYKDRITNTHNEIFLSQEFSFMSDNTFNNTIANCYAGVGKSYYIINDLIKKQIPNGKTYIVLTPSHSALKEYRENNLNCKVIQSYLFNLPKEDIIIIDELGMIDYNHWNMLYKLSLLNKKIIAFGDMNQLKPVKGEKCNNQLFINLMFRYKLDLNINRRNNFTIDYYNSLINSNNLDYLKKEVLKHSEKDYKKADFIIAYENITRIDYNEKMKKHFNIKNLYDIGCKIICKTNNLKEKNIYNNFSFIVLKNENDKIYLSDNAKIINEKFECPISLKNENNGIITNCNHKFGFDSLFKWLKENINCPLCRNPINNLIEITKEELLQKDEKGKQYFDYNYAGTTYNIQGQSLNSYYYCKEDIKYLNNSVGYTIISRLKQKVEKSNDYNFKIILDDLINI
jgi:hypothetical protein